MSKKKLTKVIQINKFSDVAECCDLTHQGIGVVKVDNVPYFVTDLLPGETAKINFEKKDSNKFGYGEIVDRYKDNENRVNPICKNFFKCGGCDLMHMNYQMQLAFKLNMVNQTFKRLGHLDFQINNIIGADDPYKYRNKVQVPYRTNNKGKVICGFYQKKSHDIVEFNECFIQNDIMSNILIFVRNLLNEFKITTFNEEINKGIFKHLLIRKTSSDKYMVVFVVNGNECSQKNPSFDSIKKLSDKIKTRYENVQSIICNFNYKNSNVILGNEYLCLYGEDYLVENILGLNFKMSHKAFFQINHQQTEKLYTVALDYANISKDDIVMDCYCGVGTIGLIASKKAKKVIGVEIIPEAIENAKENAKLNNINNVEYIVGAAEEVIKNLDNIDVLIVDPPRKGIDSKLIETILNSNIKKLVYVSCDCATMARDLSMLSEKYNILKGVAVDLFPQTADVETVVLMTIKE